MDKNEYVSKQVSGFMLLTCFGFLCKADSQQAIPRLCLPYIVWYDFRCACYHEFRLGHAESTF